MTRVRAIILHPVPGPDAGPFTRAYAAMRRANADRLVERLRAIADEATVVEIEPHGLPFGGILRAEAARDADAGLVVLGSGSIPLATVRDLATLVAAARVHGGPALANNRYSADVLAIPPPLLLAGLDGLPDLTSDNGLPRWLEERGVSVRDLRGRRRLQVDLDSPLDGVVLGSGALGAGDAHLEGLVDTGPVRRAIEAIRGAVLDPGAELLVAGRTSATTLRWLERTTASRTRALVEERGLRTARPGQRPPRSVLGSLLDARGPGALGKIVAELADGAVIDSRVLLAHRLGADESAWPDPEDRFASDLLLAERIADPWLRDLTFAAREARPPILLVGHTLVGPGLPLLLGAPLPTDVAPDLAR